MAQGQLVEFLVAGVTQAALGRAWFYEVGSSTLGHVYTDADCTQAAENPYTLDAYGRAEIYTLDSIRVRVEDSDGAEVMDVEQAAGFEAYADQISLRDASDYVGYGDHFTGTTVDAALSTALESFGGMDWEYLTSRTGGVSRKLQTKLQEVFDVRDYCTDAQAAGSDHVAYAQAALTALIAAGGGTLYFPPGTWTLKSVLTVNNFSGGLRVVCDGVLHQSTSNFSLFSLTGTTSNVWFDGIRFEGGGSASTSATPAVAISTADTVGNVNVVNCYFSGEDSSTGFNRALSLEGSGSHHVSNCHFTRVFGNVTTNTSGDCVYLHSNGQTSVIGNTFKLNNVANTAIFLTSSGDTTIAGNVIDGAATAGIRLASGTVCAVSNNIVTNSAGGSASVSKVGYWCEDCTDLTMNGNLAYNCSSHGYYLYGNGTALRGLSVTGNTARANTGSGFYVDGKSVGGVFSGNLSDGNDVNGFTWNTAAAIADPHYDTTVSGNTANANLQRGFSFVGCSWFNVTGNNSCSNSSGAGTGTYEAFYAYPYITGGNHYGGRGMVFTANAVHDSTGSRHVTGIKYRMNSDVLPSGSNYSYNCFVFSGNSFPYQNSDGTPSAITPYSESSDADEYGRYWPDTSNNMSGFRTKVVYPQDATIVLNIEDSGSFLYVQQANLGADCEIKLPNVGSYGSTPNPSYLNGVTFTIAASASSAYYVRIKRADGSDNRFFLGASNINPYIGVMTRSDKYASITLVSFDGTWLAYGADDDTWEAKTSW